MTAKKRIAAMIMTTLCLGILAACESNETKEAQPATEVPTAIATEQPNETDTAVESTEPGPNEPEMSDEPYTVLAQELRVPWVIAFHEDIVYISEREGNIVKVDGAQMTRQSVHLKKSVQGVGEGGFLGFVLSPDFAQSKTAYAYHTYEEKGRLLNRVVLLEQSGDQWNEMETLLEGIPGAANHDGGRMAFGPDKQLYVTTGDAQQRELAQDINSLAGKILRMTPSGGIPEDNPFPDSYVYSYGHRNPQGLVWNDEGILYNTEHGPSGNPGGHDEINIIEAGGNYGWPAIYGDSTAKGMIAPIYHTGEEAIAPSGATIDAGNRMLIATLVGSALYRYDPATQEMIVVFEGEGRLRDVKIKDGRVYVITNNTDGRGTPKENDDRLLLLQDLNE
ncbi:glucose/arabinose dehydrogenase [Paenibacillus endophyticus]|uniref:Glucose/arabinose dehydrogenase n=1 Tax=Paenibacillus endophyticus TaxID=1294268 RepID=A0A7W5GDP2_9BACL|nr:PQQ-dependent sugar dehydrogenase [Paenibacillus endophyticus]MBB3155663.1 glucose/arabinose dehydrogenase [Paenibacillus endophyticus]